MAASDDQGSWLWQPPANFSRKAHVQSRQQYDEMYKRSIDDPEGFWSDIANNFYWHKRWNGPITKSNFDMSKGPISIEWFAGAETNLCYNALDRHIEAGRGNETAIYWEGNDIDQEARLTWKEYKDLVCKIANYLKSQGVKKGDDVTIYLPMIAELPACLLACARIGAVHSVVFAGFSADALADRMLDSNPKVLITASAVMRGAKPIGLKKIVDDAVKIITSKGGQAPKVLVYHHEVAGERSQVAFHQERDVWWQDVIPRQSANCPVEWMPAEAPLFKLYTSGSTGKPKGVLHTTAGYMVGTATTFKYIFDYRQGDIFWCTADCGWITGHSYLTYGPMLNGAPQVVFEGVPTYPDAGRVWQIVDKVGVTLFYTAPTAIRSLMKMGDQWVHAYSRKSLRVLGSVGEPINPEAWRWYHEVVGNGVCPIVDTWWQTETGAIMITPLPGAFAVKPGSATLPFFGVQPIIVDEKGNELEGACEGALCIKQSWPSGMRTIAGDHARFEATYFQAYKGYYFSGDGCRRDHDGFYWITGRMDDVINVSGHRIGTAEVESALVLCDKCAEAAVVGVEHPVKGQAIYAFVTLMDGVEPSEEVMKELKMAVRNHIGAFTQPDVIHWAPGLPKTRSGKIMRRILRKIASKEDDQLGDTSTLADPSVVQELINLRGVVVPKKTVSQVDIPDQDGMTAVMRAAEAGDAALVAKLVASGAKLDVRNKDGKTAAYIAASKGHADVIVAMNCGPEVVNLPMPDGGTPAMSAAGHGHANVIKTLVKLRANFDLQDEDGWTALMYGAEDGHAVVCRLLTEAGCDRCKKNNAGQTAEHLAHDNGHTEALRAMRLQSDINLADENGFTPLMYAAKTGDSDLARILVRAGADLELKDRDGKTAAMHAAARGDVPVMSSLKRGPSLLNLTTMDGGTPIMSAAVHGHTSAVQYLISQGVDLDYQDEDGWTALMYAATSGHAPVAHALVAAGADTTLKNNDGETAQMLAERDNASEVVRALQITRDEINIADERGYTLAMRAAEEGKLEFLQFLISKGADIHLQNKEGKTAAMLAASAGHAKAIGMMKRGPSLLDIPAADGGTAIMSSAVHGHLDVIQSLIDMKVNLNRQDADGWTALMFAAVSGNAPAVHMLVGAGADVSIKNEEGDTAWDIAKEQRWTEVLRALELTTDDMNSVDENGNTMVMRGAMSGNADFVRRLIAKGADLNARNADGKTAAMIAAGKGHAGVVRVLRMHRGPSLLNLQTQDGGTPAMSAAVHGHAEVLHELAAQGVDLNLQDEDGWTALMYAAESGHASAVYALVTAGADVNIKNNDGQTAESLAETQQFSEVLRALKMEADLNVAVVGDDLGMTPAMNAAATGNVELLKALKARGADLSLTNKEGMTPAMLAARKGHAQILKELSEESVDQKMADGSTPVMSAAVHGHAGALHELINAKVDLNSKDADGWTALMYAAAAGHAHACHSLVLGGADVNIKNNDGDTALDLAEREEYTEAARALRTTK